MPFIAKRDYSFSETQNLSLYLFIGVVYVIGAMTSALVVRALHSLLSTRSMVAVILLVESIACSLPLFFHAPWVIWCAGGVAGICSAWLWPIVESYLVAGRHGPDMRRAIGWWNLSWMIAVAGVMFAMAPMMERHASMVIVALGGMNLLAICVLPWYGKNPGVHEVEKVREHVPPSYKKLLRGVRVLLPMSYVINGVFAPLLPYVLMNLAVDIFWQTPLTAIWMVARVVVTVVMGISGAWHGKWSVLWIAVGAMALGFVGILGASSLPTLIIGLILFGSGMGVTYYAALYYAMSVGQAEVDAGGTHEALIGSGYMVGPIVGIATIQLSDASQVQSFQPVIFVVLLLLGLSICALALFMKKAR